MSAWYQGHTTHPNNASEFAGMLSALNRVPDESWYFNESTTPMSPYPGEAGTSDGLRGGYVAKLQTAIWYDEATDFDLTWRTDDAAELYLNGNLIASGYGSCGACAWRTTRLNFQAGWNILTLWYEEVAGGDYFEHSTLLPSDRMFAVADWEMEYWRDNHTTHPTDIGGFESEMAAKLNQTRTATIFVEEPIRRFMPTFTTAGTADDSITRTRYYAHLQSRIRETNGRLYDWDIMADDASAVYANGSRTSYRIGCCAWYDTIFTLSAGTNQIDMWYEEVLGGDYIMNDDNDVLPAMGSCLGTFPLCTVTRLDANPTSSSTVHFRVDFDENVSGFTQSDVVLSGTAPGKSITAFTGSGKQFTVTVGNIGGSGTVTLMVPVGGGFDTLGNPNDHGSPVTYDVNMGPTDTPTNTMQPTDTPTNTPSFTPSNTPSNTPTFTWTNTPTETPTNTPTFTPTFTPTNTPTMTPTNTPTSFITDERTILTDADTHIRDYNTDYMARNYGVYNRLLIGYYNGFGFYHQRSLVRFGISSIPSNATIVEAKLSLYQDVGSSHASSNQDHVIHLYRLTSSWVEGTQNGAAGSVCWN
ncbi:MAG TPA: DNRLRE domain-containing protein, partial [bacterium]|nr:DNRLRE domain-containing protein [bacterium]